MTQLTLNIKDQSKLDFFLELLKRMEFVEIVAQDQDITLDADVMVQEIYEEREKSAQSLSDKLDNLFDDL